MRVKSWAYQRPSDPPQEAGVLPGTAVLFMSVNALTGLAAANRDMRVGRRLRDLETQKMWLLVQTVSLLTVLPRSSHCTSLSPGFC